MIKLKYLLCESEEKSDIVSIANSKGYSYTTYRGDVDAEEIFNYSRKERREYGIFTTPIKEIAKVYARNKDPRQFFVRSPKLLDLTNDSLENMKWVNKWGKEFGEWSDPQSGDPTSAWDVLAGGRMFDYEGTWSAERWMDIQGTAHSQGFDAVILPDFDSQVGIFPSLVVFDERNLKLSDAVTYDDERHPIPLELRFDHTNNDIRY